jgi:hypothetical protein
VRPDAVRVAPPLLVTDDEIDAALAILAEVVTEVLAETMTETTCRDALRTRTRPLVPPETEA